jgi:hypothetical protein
MSTFFRSITFDEHHLIGPPKIGGFGSAQRSGRNIIGGQTVVSGQTVIGGQTVVGGRTVIGGQTVRTVSGGQTGIAMRAFAGGRTVAICGGAAPTRSLLCSWSRFYAKTVLAEI